MLITPVSLFYHIVTNIPIDEVFRAQVRSNIGLEKTESYFKRLGINEFVNLVTSSDNYNPLIYPKCKDENAEPFLPTWMFASPTFNGLRISLSEKSRFEYSESIPDDWAEYIKKVSLNNDKIHINVDLTPGLNVVIGGSSSGKTLFVDTLYRKICDDLSTSDYVDFNIENINVDNPTGFTPHYIHQNFIIDILSNEDKGIEDIDIVKFVFPQDTSIDEEISAQLAKLKADLGCLVRNIQRIEICEKNFLTIPIFTHLFIEGKLKKNIFNFLLPRPKDTEQFDYSDGYYEKHIGNLKEIETFIKNNPFLNSLDEEFYKIKETLDKAHEISLFENNIRQILKKCKTNTDEKLAIENKEQQSKSRSREKLFSTINAYITSLKSFKKILDSISQYDYRCRSKVLEVMGHQLSIENVFVLSKEKVIEVINKFLKTNEKIESFESIRPQNLYKVKFKKQAPKVSDYDDFERKVYNEFVKLNQKKYKITTDKGFDFESISPGWKTSVLLDIILGYNDDLAPLIIDQPEDNLATNYINKQLVELIKKTKTKKQVILVSHNATIPMLGDAQNVILCLNEEGTINIISSCLEGGYNEKSMVDYIAEITDGGKPSIKKRVKKYNLKSFKE